MNGSLHYYLFLTMFLFPHLPSECDKAPEDLCSLLVKREKPVELCYQLAPDILPPELIAELAADETMDIEPCENAAVNSPHHT